MGSQIRDQTKSILTFILILFLAGIFFIFNGDIFPSPGIYVEYLGKPDFPLYPAVITTKKLSPVKLEKEFGDKYDWTSPLFHQNTVSNKDMENMAYVVKTWLPPLNVPDKDARFIVILYDGKKEIRRKVTEGQAFLILQHLEILTAHKYKDLFQDISGLEYYCKKEIELHSGGILR
jgi:hypothetical protein